MYLFFDTETTGLPDSYNEPVSNTDNWPRMVQLAWTLCDNEGKIVEKSNSIIKPEGFTIPISASDIHGITTEKAIEEGLPLGYVLAAFSQALHMSETLIAHNYDFDSKIAGAEYFRKEMLNILPDKKHICTMESTTEFVGIQNYYGYKWPTLRELYYRLFYTDFENAHDASADVDATVKCFWKLRELGIL